MTMWEPVVGEGNDAVRADTDCSWPHSRGQGGEGDTPEYSQHGAGKRRTEVPELGTPAAPPAQL